MMHPLAIPPSTIQCPPSHITFLSTFNLLASASASASASEGSPLKTVRVLSSLSCKGDPPPGSELSSILDPPKTHSPQSTFHPRVARFLFVSFFVPLGLFAWSLRQPFRLLAHTLLVIHPPSQVHSSRPSSPSPSLSHHPIPFFPFYPASPIRSLMPMPTPTPVLMLMP